MAETLIVCSCGEAMAQVGDPSPSPDKTILLTLYQCVCGRKAGLMRAEGVASPQALSWVDQRVREVGSFFPQDEMPGRFGRFSR